jgi:hypothetical protein
MALLGQLTLAARGGFPSESWLTAVKAMILPGTLLALILAQLPAGNSRRGGPLMLAALAFAIAFSGHALIERLELPGGGQPPAPLALIPGRFLPLAEEGQYLFAEQVSSTGARDLVILDTEGEGLWMLSHAAKAELSQGTQGPELAGHPLGGAAVYGGLTPSSPEVTASLTGLETDLGVLMSDISRAGDQLEQILHLLAPISVLAGLGFLVRISRWPLIGASVALGCARAALVVYVRASDPMFRRLAELLGSRSRLLPALTLVSIGALLILADLLTPDRDHGVL